MGYSPKVKAVFDPVIEFYRPVPPLAYLMVLIAWFGIGELPKLVLLYLVGLPLVSVSSAAAVQSVREERINGALSLGANQWQGVSLRRLPILLAADSNRHAGDFWVIFRCAGSGGDDGCFKWPGLDGAPLRPVPSNRRGLGRHLYHGDHSASGRRAAEIHGTQAGALGGQRLSLPPGQTGGLIGPFRLGLHPLLPTLSLQVVCQDRVGMARRASGMFRWEIGKIWGVQWE